MTETTTPTPSATTSDELSLAYAYAYKNGLTTMNTMAAARMEDKITRAELAKIVSQYAITVLGKTPDTTRDCSAFSKSIAKYTNDLHEYMITACQLEIMGIHPDATVLKDFMPDKYVTRAEF